MFTSLMVFHAIISVLLIILVLLQFGKGAEAGLLSGGGGGGSDAVFTGSQKGNILHKMTIVLSVIFLSNSILLAKIQTSSGSKSILDGEAPIAAPLNSDAKAAPMKEAAPAAKKEETKK